MLSGVLFVLYYWNKIKKNINNDHLLTRMRSLLEILCLTTLKGAIGTKIKVLCDHDVVLLNWDIKVICSNAGAISCGLSSVIHCMDVTIAPPHDINDKN